MVSPSKQERLVSKLKALKRKQGTDDEKSARQDVLELLSPNKQRELKRSKPGIWSRLVGAVKGMGQAILGGARDQGAQDQVDEKDMHDMGVPAAFQNVQLPVAPPLAVALPTK